MLPTQPSGLLVTLGSMVSPFLPWRPEFGHVFESAFAYDSETTIFDDNCPWQIPELVLSAASDGERGFFVPPGRVTDFFDAHNKMPVVMHHAVFDLAVLDKAAPD